MVEYAAVFGLPQEIPWNSRLLAITGRNLSIPNGDIKVKLSSFPCPIVEANATYIVCNLTSLVRENARGPLRAVLERDGTLTSSFLAANLVDEPRGSSNFDRTISSNARSIMIAADSLGTSLDSLAVTLLISSNQRRSVGPVSEFICSLSSLSSNGINCTLPPSSFLPSGSLLNATIARGSGVSLPFFLGSIVPAATIRSSTRKVSTASRTIIIEGTNLSPKFSTATLTQAPNASAACEIDLTRSNSTSVFCSPRAPLREGAISVLYVASEGLAFPYPATVGSAVLPPRITVSSSNFAVSTLLFTFEVSGIDDSDIQNSNLVFVTQDPNAAAASLVPCVIDASSTVSSITCKIAAPMPLGSVFARIESFGGSSPVTQIATLVDSSAISTVLPTGGIIGIAVAAGVVLAIIAVVVALVIRAKRMKAFRQRNHIDVPDEVQNLFSIRDTDLEIETKLGEGSFGAVYVFHRNSERFPLRATLTYPFRNNRFLAKFKGDYVAVKKLSASVLASAVSDFFRECSVMLSVPSHPNVIKIYGMVQELGNFGMVLEFLPNGSLDTWLGALEDAPIEPHVLHQLSLGIARGMQHLASNRIVHRDLAARNILLDSNLNPRISDFGFSRVVGDNQTGKTNTTVGPIRWMAPECIGDLQYSEKSDVWAYGCILFEILQRQEPFEGQELFEVATAIRDRGVSPQKDLTAPTPGYITELMGMCFQQRADMRPSFKEVVEFLETHSSGEAHAVQSRSSSSTQHEPTMKMGPLTVEANKKRAK